LTCASTGLEPIPVVEVEEPIVEEVAPVEGA
jgi:hypothetical protein